MNLEIWTRRVNQEDEIELEPDPDYDPEYDPRDDPNSHYYEPEWDDYYWWKKQKNRDKTVAFTSGPDLI